MIDQFKLLISDDCDQATIKQLKQLAISYGFAVVNSLDELNDHDSKLAIFTLNKNHLCLNLMLDDRMYQLTFDFTEGEIAFRTKRVSKSNESIAKAIGCKPNFRPKVLDATAGMGRDALIMATLGCQVLMQERNLAVFLLLEDALNRFRLVDSQISELMSLGFNDSNKVMINEPIDVIYLDPMFPQRKKSALVKKEMRLFKLLVGDDPDADNLLTQSIDYFKKQNLAGRVVVKRPVSAPHLNEMKPNHQIRSKNHRYDIYLVIS